MAIVPCAVTVDQHQRELVSHGTTAFPVACYHDDLSRYEVSWHWHEELEVVYIEKGQSLVAAGNEKWIIREGEGFLVNSGILHGCWDHENSGCRFHSLVFHPRLVGGSLDSVFHQKFVQPLLQNQTLEFMHLTPEVSWQAEALRAIDDAWLAADGEEFGYEFLIRGYLSKLLLLLQQNVPNSTRPAAGRDLRNAQRIKEMLQYIHEHCGEELPTREIAGAAAISESECLRCFRCTIGVTPIQYVRQYRIQRACDLLTASNLRIGEIAQQCGFSDVSYFVKTFREQKGCAPGQYRKNRAHLAD